MPRQPPQIHRLGIRLQRIQHARRYRGRQVERAEGLGGGAEALDGEEGGEPEGEGDEGAGFDLWENGGDALVGGGFGEWGDGGGYVAAGVLV